MSETRTTTRAVTSRDVERNNVTTAVLPYVPNVDEADKDPDTVEVKLPNGNKISIPFITLSANLESFATRSIVAKTNVLMDLQYKAQAEKLEKGMRDIDNKIRKLKVELSKLTTAAPASKTSSSKEAEQADKRAAAQEAKKLQITTLKENKVTLENQLKDTILIMLDTFRGYIGEELRHVWDDIIASKCGTTPWTDLQGVEHDTELVYNLDSFEMIWMFWMKDVFQEDAAEQHLEYLTYGIKLPWWLPPRKFAARVKQLNGFTNFLPCALYSPQATSQSTVPQKLTDPQLAQLLLRLSPESWKNTWKMLGKAQPQDVNEMITFQEQQFSQDTLQKSKSAKGKTQHDGNNKGDKKRKGDSNNNNRGPKRTRKHCALCKEHGGPAHTHNTPDCGLYNSDGTQKKRGKSNSNGEKKTQKNYAQQLKKLREEYKDTKKELKRLKKRFAEELEDSDTDA